MRLNAAVTLCAGRALQDETARFRSANDRMAAILRPRNILAPVKFMCECADPTCFGSNKMTLADFDRRRESGLPVIGPNCRELGGPGT